MQSRTKRIVFDSCSSSELAKILDGIRRGGKHYPHELSPETISAHASTLDTRKENQRSRAYDNRNYVSGA